MSKIQPKRWKMEAAYWKAKTNTFKLKLANARSQICHLKKRKKIRGGNIKNAVLMQNTNFTKYMYSTFVANISYILLLFLDSRFNKDDYEYAASKSC